MIDNGYASAELNLTIIGPSALDTTQTLGSVGAVSGILFGEPDSITWEHVESGKTGEITPKTFWQSAGIKFVEGDNTIVVTAVKGDEVSTDEVMITYNPAFLYDTPPVARPGLVMKGQSTKLVVTVPISYNNVDGNSVKMWAVDAAGNPVSDLGALKDNGSVGAQ